MLRAILIDDEQLAVETLVEDINKYVECVEVVATCTDSTLAKDLILEYKPDIVFLDIEMPIINGFELLNSIDKIDFEIVFVTAYDQFAVKAFEFCAADYLVKPVEKNRLISTIEKINKRKSDDDIDEKLSIILHNLKLGSNNFPTLAVPTIDGIEFIPIKDISHLKSDSNYCSIFLKDSNKLFVAKTLKHFAGILEDFGFIRVHQSYYVNVRYIRKYSKRDGGEIVLKDDTRIPISRNFKPNLLQFIRK